MKKIFFDTEFTGLHQNTTLVSIAFVSESGEEFYAEFTDYDSSQINNWILENVLSNLFLNDENQTRDLKKMYIKGNKSEIKSAFLIWLEQFGVEKDKKNKIVPSLQFWADVPHYDWVLFCELFGGARNIPQQIYFKPMDLSTFLLAKGIDVVKQDFSLEKLIDKENIPDDHKLHNALSDAKLGMKVLKKYL